MRFKGHISDQLGSLQVFHIKETAFIWLACAFDSWPLDGDTIFQLYSKSENG